MTKLRNGAVTAVIAVCVALVGGCVTPHNSLGSSAGPCFRAFDQARGVVRHGTFVGVRDVRADTAGRIGGITTTTAVDPDRRRRIGTPLATHSVCLFAFRGPFKNGDVGLLRPGATTTGRYAIVTVTLLHPRPLGARVTDTLPSRFSHR
jgi:hypothetical protein